MEDIEVLFTESWLKRTDVLYYLRYNFFIGFLIIRELRDSILITASLCRCSCFCCFSQRRLVQINVADSEREQLQEPLDQISLSSVDSVEPDEEIRTKDSDL